MAHPLLLRWLFGDCIAGLYGAAGVLVALLARARGHTEGQCVDVSILDAVFSIVGYQCVEFDQMGAVLKRTGNRSSSSVPRNVYATKDGRWITVSSSTDSIAQRVMTMVGGTPLASDERFRTPEARRDNADALDAIVADWVRQRSLAEALAEFERNDAAAAPAYDTRQIFEDAQFAASNTMVRLRDEELGDVRLPNVVPRLSETPGAVRFAGRRLGADTARILRERTSLSTEQVRELEQLGVI